MVVYKLPYCSLIFTVPAKDPVFDLKPFLSLELVEEIVTNSFRNDTGAFPGIFSAPRAISYQ